MQKAHHMGESRSSPYQFPDMTATVAPHDGFFILLQISSPCPQLLVNHRFRLLTYSVVHTLNHTLRYFESAYK